MSDKLPERGYYIRTGDVSVVISGVSLIARKHTCYASKQDVMDKVESLGADGVIKVYAACISDRLEILSEGAAKTVIENGEHTRKYTDREAQRDLDSIERTIKLLRKRFPYRLRKEGLI